ncbi:hypothetical protein PVK06_001357 [Gossypium arboreum]|uniref:Uncharacterized protein n=1 Tax=Gossypium arboreum TaxID=29729 RepID=A0ABR0R259_GOSAR|nr:hypothetical protein PVK06_001357 [Gossypium arboreum]
MENMGNDPNKEDPLHLNDENVYNGLHTHTRMVVDASANDTLLDKSYNKEYEILERIANNNYQYPTTRVGADRKVARAMELDAITSLTAQLVSANGCVVVKF